VGIALAVRLVYVFQLSANPFFNRPIVDSETYDRMASNIAEGKDPEPGPFFQPPFYPYFLGLLYAVFGRHFFTVRFVQMLLGVGNVLLAYYLAKRLFGEKIALWAGLALSLYGTMLFFEGELLAPVLIVFLNLLLVLSLISVIDRPTWWRAFLTGLLLGASALAMAVVLPFALVIIIYGLAHFRRMKEKPSWGKLVALGVCFVLGIALVISPVTYRNWKEGDPVLISYNAGVNFYIGTGQDYDQKAGIRPGYQWQEIMKEPIKAGYTKASEQSAYFVDKGLKIIAQDPLGYLGLLAKKLYLYANGNEILRNQEIYPFRQYSPLLYFLVWKWGVAFPYGILFPLAVVGLGIALVRRKRYSIPILLLIASHILVILLFFVAARYRMNILPFLVTFAVFGIAALIGQFRDRKWKQASVVCGVLALLLVLCNWNVGKMPREFNADAYYNLGVKYTSEGRPEAKDMFLKAIELEPNYPEANGNLGIIYDQEGEYQKALNCYRIVLDQYPDDIDANIDMGVTLVHLGDLEGARATYERVLQLDPNNQLAAQNIKVIDHMIRIGEAIKLNPEIEKLISKVNKDPTNPALLTNLGAAYLAIGYFDLALEPLQASLSIAPQIPATHSNLGIALAELGDEQGALREFETAIKLDPDNKSYQKNLEKLKKKE
jgi:tetratricopeptide (TPR) repeat protein